MFQVHSGPFHPVLEDAFAEVVASLKSSPFAALAVVAPSGGLRRRAEAILAERKVAALNIHFQTIGPFAEEIVAAAGGIPVRDDEKKPPTVISDPLFFDTLVRRILKDDRPFEGFTDLAVPEGFPPSVRSTLRDLIDAGVKPEVFLEAVNENAEYDIPDVDAGSLKQLIQLYRLYLQRMSSLGVASRSRLLEAAAAAAPASPYLKSMTATLFYGFNDLTGLQVELIDAVARHHTAHLFFPYVHGHPDHAFGARFRDDVLNKIPGEESVLARAEAPFFTFAGAATLKETNGLLPRALVWKSAEGRIVNVSGLRDEAWVIANEVLLLHDTGVPFSEIAVVARTRERLSQIGTVFEERKIPYVSSWKRTMGAMPQVEVGLRLLAHVAGASADRDFLHSPDIVFTTAPAPWPAAATWAESVDRAVAALDAHVRPSSELSKPAAATWRELKTAALTLREFDLLSKTVVRSEFLDVLRERWMAWPSPTERSGLGVAVLHAEAARGLPFDTVFLAGLEEKVFPRVIREDPFLRDKTRGAIVKTIGNRIGQKMLALDEERLLLNLLLNAARRRIYLTYQRSDDEGRIVGASSFLRRLLDEWGVPLDKAVNVAPRRLRSKLTGAPPAALGARDLISGLLMDGRATDASLLAASAGRDGHALMRSVAALNALETWEGAGRFDGLVGPALGAAHLEKEGMSPSGLESFARCPFQYFVRRVLRLAPLEEPVAPDGMPEHVRGKLVHGFLETFYRRCLETYKKTWPAAPPQNLYDETFDAHFATPPVDIYPLLWTAVRRGLRDSIFRLISTDFVALAERRLAPAYFEHRVASATLDPSFKGVRFEGIMDRVDVGPNGARVVDYKTGGRSKMRMSTSAVRGEKAQPTVYLLMAAEFLRTAGVDVKEIDFAYLHLGQDDPLTELTAAAWAANRVEAVDTVRAYLDFIRDGKFPFVPGRHCDWCDAATICRKTDSISAFRTAPAAEALKAVKKKKGRAES